MERELAEGSGLPRVEAWLADVQPDVLCMQETKLADAAFPALAFAALGYDGVHHGEGRWNGVAILSRVGIEDASVGFSSDDVVLGDEARLVSATCGGVRVASVYVPNGRSLDHEQYEFKLDWLRCLRLHLDAACDPSADVLVCGDFNIAPDDRDVWDPSAAHGGTHVQPARARRARRHQGVGARRRVPPPLRRKPACTRGGTTAPACFHKHLGMRIDLVLASKPLADRVRRRR